MIEARRRTLTGWGGVAPSVADVVAPKATEEVVEALAGAGPRGAIARGLGRSYGDPAQNGGGLVLDATALEGPIRLDVEAGLVTAPAGTSIDELIGFLVPRGHFVPITPGTRHVTLGGAVACDVHGKDHHRTGSWGSAIEEITLVTPAHGPLVVGPRRMPDLFWATVGGMGLTGVVVEVTFRVKPIESSLLLVDTDRTPNLDATIELMEVGDHAYDYSVAWMDLTATGDSIGRSVLDRASFATLDQLPSRRRNEPLALKAGPRATFPRIGPLNLITPLTVRAFNEAWYRRAPRRRRDHLQSIPQFFHPLDAVDRWNRVYGTGGVIQWQCAVPLESTAILRAIVTEISEVGCPSFLSVLKRFGPGNPGHLSFPLGGWTVSMDIPARANADQIRLLDRLDQRVAACGGRIYLAKDGRLRPELLPVMYPRLDEWRAIRAAADPQDRLTSDMARRLNLKG